MSDLGGSMFWSKRNKPTDRERELTMLVESQQCLLNLKMKDLVCLQKQIGYKDKEIVSLKQKLTDYEVAVPIWRQALSDRGDELIELEHEIARLMKRLDARESLLGRVTATEASYDSVPASAYATLESELLASDAVVEELRKLIHDMVRSGE